jgi:hypothetical protein
LQLPASVIALSSLAGELGNNRSAAGDAVLAACNFPSRYTRMGGISIAACALAAFFSYDSILLDIIAV